MKTALFVVASWILVVVFGSADARAADCPFVASCGPYCSWTGNVWTCTVSAAGSDVHIVNNFAGSTYDVQSWGHDRITAFCCSTDLPIGSSWSFVINGSTHSDTLTFTWITPLGAIYDLCPLQEDVTFSGDIKGGDEGEGNAGDTIRGSNCAADEYSELLEGEGADDTIYANNGFGTDPGNNTLEGGTGDDTLIGGAGVDYMYGGDDHDVMMGAGNDDVMSGGDGVDFMNGNEGDDALDGGDGGDIMCGGTGVDTLDDGGNTSAYPDKLWASEAGETDICAVGSSTRYDGNTTDDGSCAGHLTLGGAPVECP